MAPIGESESSVRLIKLIQNRSYVNFRTVNFSFFVKSPNKVCSQLELTGAFFLSRQVANMWSGGVGNCVKCFTSPKPMPRLHPVMSMDFIFFFLFFFFCSPFFFNSKRSAGRIVHHQDFRNACGRWICPVSR